MASEDCRISGRCSFSSSRRISSSSLCETFMQTTASIPGGSAMVMHPRIENVSHQPLQSPFLPDLASLIVIGLPALFQFAGEEFGGVTADVRLVVLDDGCYPPK